MLKKHSQLTSYSRGEVPLRVRARQRCLLSLLLFILLSGLYTANKKEEIKGLYIAKEEVIPSPAQ